MGDIAANVAQKCIITRTQMAARLNTSVKTIERQLRKLPNVHYKGSARDGEWVIDPSES